MLPVRPQPLPDESVAGYLVRVVERNGLESWQTLFTQAGVPPARRALAWLLTDQAYLVRLMRFIGVPVEAVAPLVYRPVPNLTRVRELYWGDQRLPTAFLRKLHAPVCPGCLRDSPHLRQAWDFSFVAACPRHRRLLLAVCPSCQEPIPRNRASVTCCPCGADLSHVETPKADTAANAWLEVERQPETLPARPSTALAALARLTALFLGESCLEPQTEVPSEALMQQVNDASNLALRTIRNEDKDSALKELLARRMARWPELGAAAAPLPFLRPESTIELLPDPGRVKAVARTVVPCQSTPPSSLDGLEVSAWATGTLLGMSANGIASAVTMGKLSPISLPGRHRTHTRLFAAADIRDILRKLGAGDTEDHTFIGRAALGNRFSLAAILDGLEHGRLKTVSYDPLEGLGKARFARIATLAAPEKEYSVLALARQWNVHPEHIWGLIRNGLLPTRQTNVGNRISAEVAEKFAAEYIFPRELAARHGASAFAVARKLVKLGYSPAFSPHANGSTVYVFRRADLAGLQWSDLDRTRGLHIRSRKRPQSVRDKEIPPNLLTAGEAQREFGLSVQQLSSLARRGILERRAAPIAPKRLLYYRRADVAKYIASYRDNPDLLTLAEAANSIEESIFEFTMRWPQTDLLHIVDGGIEKYVRRTELDAVAAIKKSFASVEEAAQILGTDRQTIMNWIRSGWLAAAKGPTIDNTRRYLLDRSVVAELKSRVDASPNSRLQLLGDLGLKRRRRRAPKGAPQASNR